MFELDVEDKIKKKKGIKILFWFTLYYIVKYNLSVHSEKLFDQPEVWDRWSISWSCNLFETELTW